MGKPIYSILSAIFFMVFSPNQFILGQENETSRVFNMEVISDPKLFDEREKAWKLLRKGNVDSALLVSITYLHKSELKGVPVEYYISAHSHMALLLMRLKNHRAGQQYCEKAISLYEKFQFKPSPFIEAAYGHLASVHYSNQNFGLALSLYKKSLALNRKFEIPLHESSALNNIGLVSLSLGQLDSASYYFFKAKDLLKKDKVEHQDLICSINDNLGNLALLNKAYEDAFLYYDANCKIVQPLYTSQLYLGDRLISGNIGKAKACLGRLNLTETAHYLKKAESNLQHTTYRKKFKYQIDIEEVKQQIFKLTSDLDNYVTAGKQKAAFIDSLHVMEVNAQALISEKMLDLQLETADLKLSSQRQQLRFNGLLALSLGITFLISLLFFVITLKRRSTQLTIQNQLSATELKNRELEKEKMRLQLKNQEGDLGELSAHTTLLRQLAKKTRQKLKSLGKLDEEEQKTELHTLSIAFSQPLNNEKIQGLIQSNLNEVNNVFFGELDRRTNQRLSQNEKELCVLFRLKLSDQQIAEMKDVGIGAVRVARYRIKKKLGLEKDDRIGTYLSNIECFTQ